VHLVALHMICEAFDERLDERGAQHSGEGGPRAAAGDASPGTAADGEGGRA
jgi:hypothetical protein